MLNFDKVWLLTGTAVMSIVIQSIKNIREDINYVESTYTCLNVGNTVHYL